MRGTIMCVKRLPSFVSNATVPIYSFHLLHPLGAFLRLVETWLKLAEIVGYIFQVLL